VPKEVLFNNAKTVMIKRDALGEGQHRWHEELTQLAKDYGFKPGVCKPYRAQTKGKVERFNGYLKPQMLASINRATHDKNRYSL
jgi:transposase